LVPTLPAREVLINPDAYVGFYRHLLASGRRFVDATRDEREVVCIDAMKSAVIAPGDSTREIVAAEGWVAVHPDYARQIIADFLDPEALLL